MTAKIKKITSILTVGCVIFLSSCGSSTSDSALESTDNSSKQVTEQSTPTDIYGINGEEIVIRSGPGKEYEKVVNQKTTEIVHKTVYATVDYSVKVREDDIKNGWSKIVVVDPDYLSESHQGWIETKYILKENNAGANTNTARKLALFNDVSTMQKSLGKNGIGEFRKWRGDELGWISSTDYYAFGSSSPDNGMQNNLAYYLESDNQNSVKTVKLILNINNKTEKSQALSLLGKTAQKTFASLNLEIPQGLLDAIKSSNNFKADNSDFGVSLSLDRSKVDTWKVIIETK